MKRRLLAEPDLTFKKAFELAQASEIADRDKKDIQELQTTTLHAVSKATISRNKPSKTSWGKHSPDVCFYKTATCHFCSKTGHIATVCLSKAKQKSLHPKLQGKAKQEQKAH